VKVALITLGCDKNTVEAEYLLGSFADCGFAITPDITQADIITVHTCSFIGDARLESIAAVKRALSLKHKPKVYVTGCLPQLDAKLLPSGISGYLGTGQTKNLPGLILQAKPVCNTSRPGGFNDNPHRILSSHLDYAYLKIAEGCNHKCSFCVIARIRGKYQSRSIASLTDEAKILADAGIKELILIAQDTTSYGIDLYGRLSLSKLLKNLCKISGIKRIRLMYAYPPSITANLLSVMADYAQICDYIDVPVQHISKNVLKRMRRPLNTRSVIYDIMKKLPSAAIRTTFITGFPGETQNDFNELLSFVKEGNFMYAGAFCYSDEGLNIKPSVALKTALERKTLLEKAQQTVFDDKIGSLAGTTAELFIESCSGGLIKGRLPFQSPGIDGITILESSKPLKAPSVKKVVIAGSDGYNIKAKL